MERLEGTGFRTVRPAIVASSLAAACLLLIAGVFLLARPTDRVLVRFSLAAPDAGSVTLAGDFTGWNEHALEMSDTRKDGVWELHLRLRKGKVYTYNFIIDGETWIPDPESTVRIDDGFGGESSLLRL